MLGRSDVLVTVFVTVLVTVLVGRVWLGVVIACLRGIIFNQMSTGENVFESSILLVAMSPQVTSISLWLPDRPLA